MRLIDADALEKEIREKDIMGGLNYSWYIQNAPTVDVLDKIRAEIKHLLNRPSLTHVIGYDKGFVDGIDKVLQIIDKYTKEVQ